jgi:DNA repair protein RecN (Recombination protein N)
MLQTLYIKDYALIEKVTVEFGRGLNIITGETGAGKSILIDAMSLLLGERASSDVVRKGADKSVVEGIFNVAGNKKVKSILEENEIDLTDELIVRREISLKGSNRCFLNDSPVTLNIFKDIGNFLVDLHGQHEHQSLLRTETHIEFLDEYGMNDNLLTDYQTAYKTLSKLLRELKELEEKENLLKEKKEIYSFQLSEIDAVSPVENEDEQIKDELIILENSEKILELTNSVCDNLYDSEESVYDKLSHVKTDINELAKIDKSFSQSAIEIEGALSALKEVSATVSDYKSKVYLDPERLETLRERLTEIKRLNKKYGGSISAVIEHRSKIAEEVHLADNFDIEISKLNDSITAQRKKCGEAALALSNKRKESAKKVSKEVKETLTTLGIQSPSFEVRITQSEANGNNYIIADNKKYSSDSNGIDEVEFFISTNLGEDVKPLAKVASGGEISRIMLALKTSLAKNDKLPLLIFDEIDVGVSGRIAQKVGQALKALSGFHQIIAITHQPQIAGLANHHFAVEKNQLDGRVVSSLRELKENERLHEVAKLLSGEKITDASLNSAKELMGIG